MAGGGQIGDRSPTFLSFIWHGLSLRCDSAKSGSIVRSEMSFCSDQCSGTDLILTQHHFPSLSLWLWKDHNFTTDYTMIDRPTPCSNVSRRMKRVVRWFQLLCFVPHHSLHKAPSPHQISLGLPKMGQQSCQPFALHCCSLVHLACLAKKVISQWRKTNRLASESHVTSMLLLEQNWN